MRKVLSTAAALMAVAIGSPAAASEILWLDSDHTAYSGEYSTGTSLLFSGGGVNVRASAWSIHDDGDIYKAKLGVWAGGLGVTNGRSDNSHTIDNSGFQDFVLLQFDQVVELESARFLTGWHGMYDTDATIGYSVTNLPFGTPPALNGLPQSSLAGLNLYSSGNWGYSGDSYRNVNYSDKAGNLWLIGASFSNPEGNWKLDGFKLEKLRFTVPPPAVPEPSTWAMLLLGFFGLGGVLRRSERRRELFSGQATAA